METFFTSESVSEGHPDKLADQISDAILDEFLTQNPLSRVSCETILAKDQVFVVGEVDAPSIDLEKTIRKTIEKVGYNAKEKGFDFNTCNIQSVLSNQSPDIKSAVRSGDNQGAGDQGLMFGYAVDETKQAMPLSIYMSHKLMENLAHLRHHQQNENLWPDAKSQVTVRYKGTKLQNIATVVVSSQHSPSFSLKNLEELIREELIKKTIPAEYLTKDTKIIVNPGGAFTVGGPTADSGLTGRKIIVDTYGGHGAHGGGAFSGKDPSKMDRSGAYIARHIAKNIVHTGLAKKCLVQISYAIGLAEPINVSIDHFGTSKVPTQELEKKVSSLWDLRPSTIIKDLDLLKRCYLKTACYGHFGREEENFTWEKTNKTSDLSTLK